MIYILSPLNNPHRITWDKGRSKPVSVGLVVDESSCFFLFFSLCVCVHFQLVFGICLKQGILRLTSIIVYEKLLDYVFVFKQMKKAIIYRGISEP